MKNPLLPFVTLLMAGSVSIAPAFAGTPNRSSSPIIITPPAVNDGSISSRAPFPAARQFDDVKKPDGHAIDTDVAPNTPATNPLPLPPPAPQIAVLQPQVPNSAGTSMTGRAAVGVSAPLDAARIVPSLRATAVSAREETINDVEIRVRSSETSMASMRRSVDQMTAEGRAQFHAANADVNEKEKALRASIKAARKADASNWDAARAQLAADYSAYADSLARIDAAAGITPPAR